ncbi:arylsulfatase [Sphingomonas sp. RP10(2022)]|uniref:Arylsulfatase n=1 Tax=Sphingomonas liriopis TaxID=2949094 RepID=A0A9X2HPT7_9SPHN|nr:arylsulfatase [Sphingomonas liriopis]MCP3733537.1 arylsulfatase [Sphingomonas liriopis]
MKRRLLTVASLLTLVAATTPADAQAPAGGPVASPPAPLQRQAPKGAPNVVLVLLDDVGFGTTSTFGGPVDTPALTALAAQGLRFNRFHTTAMCSPTRASLLTGRNPHATGVGAVVTDSRPGYTGLHGRDTATIAEILRENGYSTGAFGKWHQTAAWQTSPSGPFDAWPTGEGFERFYGFEGGETDQFEPSLYDGTTPVPRPAGAGYHLTQDLVDHGVDWFRTLASVTPDKPFFLYLAPGAIHAPIQVPPEWIARYKGKFDQGWDKLREETFARQKRLGIIPANTELTPRPAGMPAWDSLSPDERRFASRVMEAYAGFMAHTDAQIGRLIQSLKDAGKFDNTLFIYVVGDNGASAEGGLGGSLNYLGALQGMPETLKSKIDHIDTIGTRHANAHINAAWAWAADTPFQWTKAVASHLGGTRNGMVVSWPARIHQPGGLRSQFGHVNDVVPTILDAVGLPAPATVLGVPQKPMNGTSLLYTFDDAAAAEQHRTQYFEIFGHRAIYHDGWMASAFHTRLPWGGALGAGKKPFEEDRWELYDLRTDFSQAHDLAAREPARLREMQALFTTEAAANQVLPLMGQQFGGGGLPTLATGQASQTYHRGAVGIPESALPRIFNRPWSVEADVTARAGARGVIATLGGSDAGWSMYVDPKRRPVFTYRLYNIATVTLRGKALPVGPAKLRFDFVPVAKGLGQPVRLQLIVNGTPVAQGMVPTSPMAFYSPGGNTFDVGVDTGAPAGDYPADAPVGNPATALDIGAVTVSLR